MENKTSFVSENNLFSQHESHDKLEILWTRLCSYMHPRCGWTPSIRQQEWTRRKQKFISLKHIKRTLLRIQMRKKKIGLRIHRMQWRMEGFSRSFLLVVNINGHDRWRITNHKQLYPYKMVEETRDMWTEGTCTGLTVGVIWWVTK